MIRKILKCIVNINNLILLVKYDIIININKILARPRSFSSSFFVNKYIFHEKQKCIMHILFRQGGRVKITNRKINQCIIIDK